MSSKSRSVSRRKLISADVCVIGEGWQPLYLTYQLLQKKLKPQCLYFPQTLAPFPIYVGNGELAPVSELIFGKPTSELIWDLSEKNFRMAEEVFSHAKIPFEKRALFRYGKTGVVKQTEEAALRVDWKKFEAHLKSLVKKEKCLIETKTGPETLKLSSGNNFSFTAELGRTLRIQSPVAVVTSESRLATWFPELNNIIIPVTLSIFPAKPTQEFPFSMALFNNGADFAVNQSNGLWLGSYRNLYQDNAVGRKKTAAVETRNGVDGFFKRLEWIKPKVGLRAFQNLYESLSCDGLPVMDSLSTAPGVFVLGGFAARSQNFFFSASASLAESLATGRSEMLRRFSLRRFVS